MALVIRKCRVKRYLSKISSPLLDRIDLHVEVTPASYDELSCRDKIQLDSASIRTRVLQAREVQAERFKHHHLAEAIHYLSLDREGWAG